MAEIKLNDNILTVSTSPHIRSEESISKIMWNVNAALAPAALFGIYNFGIHALIVIVVSIIAAVAGEYFVQKVRGK